MVNARQDIRNVCTPLSCLMVFSVYMLLRSTMLFKARAIEAITAHADVLSHLLTISGVLATTAHRPGM